MLGLYSVHIVCYRLLSTDPLAIENLRHLLWTPWQSARGSAIIAVITFSTVD